MEAHITGADKPKSSRSLSRLLIFLIVIVGLMSVLAIYFYGDSSVLSPKFYSKPCICDKEKTSNMAFPSSMQDVLNDTHKLAQLKARRFIILDWSAFSNNKKEDRFVGNCFVTRNKEFLKVSDAVAVTNRKQMHFRDFPKVRHPWQRWVWILDESPFHSFDGNDFNFGTLRGLFNWTMTYRMNSDVYMPYGWTVRKTTPEDIPDFIGKQPKLAVAVVSNCGTAYVHNARYKYIQELQKYIPVDVFGACTGKHCEGRTKSGQMTGPCPKIKEYRFYLAFENANCKEYISEKTFSNGFGMGTVPVVMGAPKEDYVNITPPNSFIYAHDFKTSEDLGKYLKSVFENHTRYMEFHEWRRSFSASYRVQYINDDPLWESLCNALGKSKGETKVYDDLGKYWTRSDCEPHKN